MALRHAVMNAFDWIGAACRNGGRHYLTALCMGAALAGCDSTDTRVSHDAASLRQHIRPGALPQAVRYEVATLPESNGRADGVPGPTDYVALIAAVTLSPAERPITNRPFHTAQQPIPEPFLRQWLTAAEKAALHDGALQEKGRLAYNVADLATRPVTRAIAVPVDAEHWVFYLEYVTP